MDDRIFFDNLAPIWDENEVLSTPDRVNMILDYIDLQPGQAVLDLGTGTGVLLPYIAERIGETGTITAVDYSSGMLSRARKKFRDLIPAPEFLNLDFENETIPHEYDRIILYCVFPHLHNPVATLNWLQKVNLKEEGSMFIAFPCGPDFINSIHKDRHSESDLLPTASKLTEYLKENGLNASVLAETNETYVIKIKKHG